MRRFRPLLALACIVLGFLAVVAWRSGPANPASRLPGRYRLAALIEREQGRTAALRAEVAKLRRQVDDLVAANDTFVEGAAARDVELAKATLVAGLARMRGPGLKVTLDDSPLDEAPSGDINDLVIHSQDVQAAVNAVWRAGAEAVAINGQRLVGTSAVLCVGNTLLLNGTVHSPPYVISAVGAERGRFDDDPLIKQLRSDADAFGLRISVEEADDLEVPAFRGATGQRFAKPVLSAP